MSTPDIATEIGVPGANCPWCINEALERLRALDGVTEVRSSMSAECIYVTHPGVDLAVIVDTLRASLRGASPDPESEMVPVEPEPLAGQCPHGHAHVPIEPQVIGRERGLMETMTAAVTRLRAAGYESQLSATEDGRLLCPTCGVSTDPEAMIVHEIVRFEGESNPDDEAILVALQCTCGHRGQYSAAFGPDTPPEDAAVLRHLRRVHAPHTSDVTGSAVRPVRRPH